VPAARTGVEVQVGAVPGYYLSQSTTEEQNGAALGQIAAVLDIGDEVAAKGLYVGGRVVGPQHDTQAEPMIGYRQELGPEGNVAVGGAVHGAHGSASENGNSYEATRVGAELAVDVRLFDRGWFEPHLMGAISATALKASGDYCVDETTRYGADCPEEPMQPPTRMTADVSGIYPAVTGGVAFDLFRNGNSAFHGGRIAALIATGMMPRVVAGEQESSRPFYSIGLTLSLGLGASGNED
jgi:hypothetical protein